MSRAEEITGEVSRVVQTCRRLEAQLQQSIPKKTHEETVAKFQSSVDGLTAELSRTKAELENAAAIGQKIARLENQIVFQNDAISFQGRTFESFSAKLAENSVPFSAYSDAISKVQAMEEKVSSMVEASEYAAAQKRSAELEDQIASMVPRAQYAAVELELAQSVPLQKYEDLLRNFEQTVPLTQLTIAEGRIVELEKSLANSVPRQDFEDLTGRIAQITREATELVSRPYFFTPPEARIETAPAEAPVEISETHDTPPLEAFVPIEEQTPVVSAPEEPSPIVFDQEVVIPQEPAPEIITNVAPEAVIPEIMETAEPVEVQTESVPTPEVEVPMAAISESVPFEGPTSSAQEAPFVEASPPAQEALAAEATSPAQDAPVVEATPQDVEASAEVKMPDAPNEMPYEIPAPAQEITEVQSNLAEINTVILTGVSSVPETHVVDNEKGFKFSNTEFCAKSGLEFLEDVEKVDISVIASHSQNGDFERWFHDVLVDEAGAQSLKTVRESNPSGEELRTMLVAAIAPRYRS